MHFPLQLEQKVRQPHVGCPSDRIGTGMHVKPKVSWLRENGAGWGSEVFIDRVGGELEVM